jgi:nucleoside-diphosphate-sugar epimerase
MNTIVIGASGFIGSEICNKLSANGHKVFAVSRTFNNNFNKNGFNIEVIQADITESHFFSILDALHVDNVIFTISLDKNTSEKSSIKDLSDINIITAWKTLEYFKNKGIKNFIYFSTIQVLGNLINKIINEDLSKNPLNKYALTHSIVEDLILYYKKESNINFKILRLANGFGFNQDLKSTSWDLFLNDIILTSFRDRKICIKSNVYEARDFIHLNEIVSVVKFLLENNTNETIFNVSSGNTLTLFETATIVNDIYKERYKKELELNFNNFEGASNYKFDIINRNLTLNGYEISPDVLKNGIIDTYIKLEQYFEKSQG